MRKPKIKKRKPILLGVVKIDLSKFDYVMDSYDINEEQVTSRSRKPRVTECRHVIMYLLRQKKVTHIEIGRKFNRDHSSVVHAEKTIKDYMDVYPDFKIKIDHFERVVKL